MAAYAATVVIKSRYHDKVGLGKLGIIRGTVAVTNYNTTTAPITDITKHFRDDPTVIIEGVSTTGYLGNWIGGSTDTVKCWIGDYNNGTDGPLIQAASDVNCGVFNFIAIGRVA